MRDRLNRVLDEKVRPLLRTDGGDLEVISLDEDLGELTVRLIGKCSACPSAEITMESIVRNEVLAAIPEIRTITLDAGVSEEMLDLARRILRHETMV